MTEREHLVARLRAVIEWVSTQDHGRAVELDRVVHDLETLAYNTGLSETQDATQRIIDLHEEAPNDELRHGHWEGHGSDERWIRDEPNECPICREPVPCHTVRVLTTPGQAS